MCGERGGGGGGWWRRNVYSFICMYVCVSETSREKKWKVVVYSTSLALLNERSVCVGRGWVGERGRDLREKFENLLDDWMSEVHLVKSLFDDLGMFSLLEEARTRTDNTVSASLLFHFLGFLTNWVWISRVLRCLNTYDIILNWTFTGYIRRVK